MDVKLFSIETLIFVFCIAIEFLFTVFLYTQRNRRSRFFNAASFGTAVGLIILYTGISAGSWISYKIDKDSGQPMGLIIWLVGCPAFLILTILAGLIGGFIPSYIKPKTIGSIFMGIPVLVLGYLLVQIYF
ncbi:MAG: hypothetical protein NT027_19770 [Proteobacteria bacterium]|nr:hypothetical protein [Pseudomonadota bacterium]